MEMSDRLHTAPHEMGRCARAMIQLTGIWPASGVVPVWWDGFYRVFCTRDRQATYRVLFGSHATLRSITGRRSIRRCLGVTAAITTR
jgi:hypothetical protein